MHYDYRITASMELPACREISGLFCLSERKYSGADILFKLILKQVKPIIKKNSHAMRTGLSTSL